MHHPRQAKVLHIGLSAGDLGRNIDPRHGFAHDLESPRVLQRRLGLRLHVQQGVGDDVPVGELAPIGGGHGAVLGLELIRRQAKTSRGLGHQDRTCLRRGPQDGGAAVLHRTTAGREAFVGR